MSIFQIKLDIIQCSEPNFQSNLCNRPPVISIIWATFSLPVNEMLQSDQLWCLPIPQFKEVTMPFRSRGQSKLLITKENIKFMADPQ